jgi:hypothetical protein
MSCRVRAARTCGAVRPSGKGTSTTYRLDRSTSVPIADFPPLPMSRSPSQCPEDGAVLGFAGAIAEAHHVSDPPGAGMLGSLVGATLRALSAQTGRQFLAQSPTGLDKQCAIDGFVRDARGQIVRIVIDQARGDLQGRPTLKQSARHFASQATLEGQFHGLWPAGSSRR